MHKQKIKILTKRDLHKMKKWLKWVDKIEEEAEDLRYRMSQRMTEKNRYEVLSLDSWIEIISELMYRAKKELKELVCDIEDDYFKEQ